MQSSHSPPVVSVLIPVRNDARALERLLRALSSVKLALELDFEIIVVDGESTDASAQVANGHEVTLLRSVASRGCQLQAGVETAQGAYLWFVHADSQFPPAGLASCLSTLSQFSSPSWGCFDIRLTGLSSALPVISWFMNWRSRLTSICTGDQGMFCAAELLHQAGGIPTQPLMEDIELSRRLRKLQSATRPHLVIHSDGRRWDERGVVTTVLHMWWFRLRYYLGASAADLAKEYYPETEEHR